ncbi:odorant receptor 9a-like [Anopheles aquasalis]|uniref:odorant receptor 9a-like n=1 Tax=Anopheles aquasalis TaxID=42839 RepID=UPI00215B0E3E|nr:odorant receptor 9a-like [Anopheles aquasalis]
MVHVDNFLSSELWFLRYCGVLRENSMLWNIRRFYCFLVLISFLILQTIYIFQNVDNFLAICDVIPTMVVCMVAISKFYMFVFHSSTIFALIDSFKKLQVHSNCDGIKIFHDSSQFHAKLTKIYITSSLIVGWFYILNAVVATVRQADQNIRFVAPMAFPHSYQHPVTFFVTFLVNCDSIHMSIFISASVDTCFSELATHVAIHFNILQHRFQALDFSKERNREFKSLMHYHKDVLKLCLSMTNLFSYTVFFLLLLDSLLLCVIGYQMVVFFNTPRMLMLLSFGFVMILQAVIYTYHGSRMYYESLRVADALYQSNWYDGKVVRRKELLFCMLRAQKPIITRGGFITATLPTLKKILSSSGSYITMLLSFDS